MPVILAARLKSAGLAGIQQDELVGAKILSIATNAMKGRGVGNVGKSTSPAMMAASMNDDYDKFSFLELLAWLAMVVFIVIIVAFLLTSCQATGVDATREIAPTPTATAPVTTGDVGGDVTTFNIAGNAPWGVAGLLVLLWASTWRGRSVATTALHRCVDAIEKHGTPGHTVEDVKKCIEANRLTGDLDWLLGMGYKPNAGERLIRHRLAKLKGES